MKASKAKFKAKIKACKIKIIKNDLKWSRDEDRDLEITSLDLIMRTYRYMKTTCGLKVYELVAVLGFKIWEGGLHPSSKSELQIYNSTHSLLQILNCSY